MKKTQRTIAACLAAALAFGMAGCSSAQSKNSASESDTQTSASLLENLDLEFTDRDKNSNYDALSATHITLSATSIEITGEGASSSENTATINSEGTYIVEGELSNGQLAIDAPDDAKLQVVLANANIHNETGPALYIKNADKVFLTLAESTTNTLSDGTSHTPNEDGDELQAALFSKDDLTINGKGSLTVNGNYRHAIKSNDDLVITDGKFNIEAIEDGFNANDNLKIANGEFAVNVGDDAFHSDLLTYFANGNIDVQKCYEGYEGQVVIIDGGTHNITAEDDAINAALADSSSDAQVQQTQTEPPEPQQQSGEQTVPDKPGTANDQPPQMPENTNGQPPQMPNNNQSPQMPDTNNNQPPQASEDEQPPQMPNADNMQRPNDNEQAAGQPEEMAKSSSECLIRINDGALTLIGGNDAIDSNGNVELNGGTIIACGPSNGMDGALDYDINATINGGTILMLGSIGSTRGLDESAQEYQIEQLSGQAGNTVQLVASDGTVLLEAKAPTAFQSVLASASQTGFAVNVV